ncbi:pantetheine-phosphate adenylyltransferase [Lentilactobacillus sp. IMAU92037]|uniref:pantetheine-phosphate adenylyltransferase n=1 Tax=Lentilactobacillus TaxID=2767893 RepID=UPI001C281468|nr:MULTISPECIES: pantetheine-phosphate adenylyltransferase [Lentilactobacillus]MBU9788215.1 pantetheine-phosphate adenylyltransferase [Lentilactobacillus dabitei]MBV0930672.1 pantetheine-phosphate adenylyltransferase [Lentilactobacillus dabitei]MDM7517506.1 pantetheine-phosphate adenylyltransferase [Lentilactobacillus sp. TOM.63]
MTAVLYAGSFDPITLGHVDVIQRASRVFDKVYVAISINTHKKATFTPERRAEFAKDALADLDNVEVMISDELTVELAKSLGTTVLLRGVRGSSDLDSEMAIAGLNEKLDSHIQTVFIPTAADYRDLSSSMIKEIAKFHGDISKFLPAKAANALKNKYL